MLVLEVVFKLVQSMLVANYNLRSKAMRQNFTSLTSDSPLLRRVLDVEPESDADEEAILERRRQLRQAIVNKYRQSAPTTPQGAAGEAETSPAPPSEADSETIGEKAAAEVQEEQKREEEEGGGEGEEGEGGVSKKDPEEEQRAQEELKKKKTNLAALREQVRNGDRDMFSDDYLFLEMQLVCCLMLCTYLHTLYTYLYMPTYLPVYLHAYLPTYLPMYLPTYLPTHLLRYTYLPTYLPRYVYT